MRDHDAATALAAHLRQLEESLLSPSVRRDRAAFDALLAEEFREFGSSGREWSRQQTLDLLATEDFIAPDIEDFQCERIAAGVALATYRSVRTDPASGQERAVLRSSLWLEEAGIWRVRFHQGTVKAGTAKCTPAC